MLDIFIEYITINKINTDMIFGTLYRPKNKNFSKKYSEIDIYYPFNSTKYLNFKDNKIVIENYNLYLDLFKNDNKQDFYIAQLKIFNNKKLNLFVTYFNYLVIQYIIDNSVSNLNISFDIKIMSNFCNFTNNYDLIIKDNKIKNKTSFLLNILMFSINLIYNLFDNVKSYFKINECFKLDMSTKNKLSAFNNFFDIINVHD